MHHFYNIKMQASQQLSAIAYVVHILAQFMQQPLGDDLVAAHRVLWYLKATPAQFSFYSAKCDLELSAYCDADRATCPISSSSISGHCMLLGGSIVSWKTKKQQVVSTSSAESEYRAMSHAGVRLFGCEVYYLVCPLLLNLLLHCCVTISPQFTL